jgi:hypothetical protein
MLFGQMSEVNVAQRSGQRIALNETCFEKQNKIKELKKIYFKFNKERNEYGSRCYV